MPLIGQLILRQIYGQQATWFYYKSLYFHILSLFKAKLKWLGGVHSFTLYRLNPNRAKYNTP